MTVQRRDTFTPLSSSTFQYDRTSNLQASRPFLSKSNLTMSPSKLEEGWDDMNKENKDGELAAATSSDGLSSRSSSSLYAMNISSQSHGRQNGSYTDRDREEFNVSVGKYKEEMRKRRISSSGGCSKMCNFFVDRVQSIYLPSRLSSYLPVSSSDEYPSHHPTGRVPLVHGIDKVVNGTRPASEMVSICGIKPLRYFWYMLSGGMCDFVQLAIDFFLLHTLQIKDPSTCWALGFGISIVVRHTSHRYLVFGMYVGGYWKSLARMYAGYSIIIAISTLFNIFMTKVLMLSHYTAWVATLLWTGIVNYFILKYIWSFDGKKKNGNSGSGSGSRSNNGASYQEGIDTLTLEENGSMTMTTNKMGGREVL